MGRVRRIYKLYRLNQAHVHTFTCSKLSFGVIVYNFTGTSPLLYGIHLKIEPILVEGFTNNVQVPDGELIVPLTGTRQENFFFDSLSTLFSQISLPVASGSQVLFLRMMKYIRVIVSDTHSNSQPSVRWFPKVTRKCLC